MQDNKSRTNTDIKEDTAANTKAASITTIKTVPKKDTQARAWQITINNPLEKDMGQAKIKATLAAIPSMVYWCMCDEIGAEGTPHTHIYFKTRNPIRFSTLKNKFPTAHIEAAQGSPQDNRDYIFKEGRWKDSEKGTNLASTREEWGTLFQSQQGKRTDLEHMYALVKEGYSDAEILELCPETAIKYIDKIGRLRNAYLTDKFKGQRRLDLKVHYITGKTGCGKSRDILDEFGDENVYRVTDYKHPFDSYQLEPVLVLEEYRSSIRLQDALNYLDIYPVTLPARYSPKTGCYNTVLVVSNWSFEQQYSELQKDSEQKSSYDAWVRRFNGYVKEYYDVGKYRMYNTMQEYLQRNEQFRPLSDVDKTPFDIPEPQQEKLPFED